MQQDLTLFQAKLLSEQALTADIALLTFKYPNTNTPFTYQAGQYIHMLLADGRFAPLSIANAPHHATLEFHLRLTRPRRRIG